MILYCVHYFFVFLFGAILGNTIIGITNPRFWILIVLGSIILLTGIMLDNDNDNNDEEK